MTLFRRKMYALDEPLSPFTAYLRAIRIPIIWIKKNGRYWSVLVFQFFNGRYSVFLWKNGIHTPPYAPHYRRIYPEELELKVEHSGNHASFLNLDITIKDGIFVYKLFDKRDAFPFSIVRMPHIDSNIPESIFYSSFVGEFLRIARSTLRFEDLKDKAKVFIARMRSQGANDVKLDRSLRRIIKRHDSDFSRFQRTTNVLIVQLLK